MTNENKPSLRERFRDRAREIGNRIYPRQYYDSGEHSRGLGDILTEKASFRNAGAAIGGITGLTTYLGGIYEVTSLGGEYPIQGLLGTVVIGAFTLPFAGLWAAGGGGLGYEVGQKIDALLGDESSELKQRREIKARIKYYKDPRNFMTPEELEKVEAAGGIRKYKRQRQKFLNKYTEGGALGAP